MKSLFDLLYGDNFYPEAKWKRKYSGTIITIVSVREKTVSIRYESDGLVMDWPKAVIEINYEPIL